VGSILDFAEIERTVGYNPFTADYLINMSEQFRYLYVETPKVACSSIKRQLQYAELDGRAEMLPENPHDRAASPLDAPSSNMDLFRTALGGDFFRFCFVRNPYTRALSSYLEKFVQSANERARLSQKLGLNPDVVPSFAEYLAAVSLQPQGTRDIHWETQAYLLRPKEMNYSFIGRFEDFAAQFRIVVEHLKMPMFEGASVAHATGAASRVTQHYGAVEKALVREIYLEDFLTFGYGFGLELI
jgi:hypothetical protein